ncbi:bifunctional polysaccharide deacetylase/glycosyltransferase family 2 protein [Asanoa siamensis]|uniref:Bi-functional transferase/deacetylase n=1 Tax=Asanoa siamensis TaxID=926357 RepID=A0ABQ4D451_9ACTN|nr:bifunctional polysaccharide deacetylase/glycosyltransferase family 2 protein [Asanoa siamensis]GIF78312.1 bi-functional transferase/deacetylase [Asanoa siamensis]
MPARHRPRHVARRDPRAHWVLFALGLVVLLAGLAFDGYARGGGGGSGRPGVVTEAATPLGGPFLRADRGGLVSRSLPARTVALTFDDGPDPRWTPQVLDVLRRHGVPGTFFAVGSRVDAEPELARRIVAEGHDLGSHTFTHADLGAAATWRRRLELTLTRNAIAGATGGQAPLFRPPYSSRPGDVSADDLSALRDATAQGQTAVLADLDTNDWQRPGVDAIVRAGLPAGDAGTVLLLHDGGGDRSQTVAALDQLIPMLQGRGYRFTTVSAALGVPAPAASAGDRIRGTALRWFQGLGGVLSAVMTWLLVVALVLGVARLAFQAGCAWWHARRRRPSERGVWSPVSVIVPAYNEAANIRATVLSLVGGAHPSVEVIVVDDGSTDGTADIVARLGLPGVRVVRQRNAGKPAALNTGIAAARADLLVLVDGDTVFQPDTVHRLVQPFADPRVGAVSGNAKVANRSRWLGRWQHLEYVIGFNLDRRMYAVLRCMPTIPGAVGAFRRAALRDVGGVPGDTLAEDTDLTMALHRAGWEVAYAPRAVAWTEAPATLRQLWRQRYRWGYGTMQAMWKHRAALTERGRLGRRALPYLAVFQVLLPLTAPAVDVFAVYGLLFLPTAKLALGWLLLLTLQAATAAFALRLDGESLRPLWTLPFQQILYRQVMYLVVVQAAVTALLGTRLRWHRMTRTGAAAALGPEVSAGQPPR